MCVKCVSLVKYSIGGGEVKERESEGGFVLEDHLWKWVEFLVLQFQCSLGRSQVNHFCPANTQHCPHMGKASRYVSETTGMDFSFLSGYGFQFSVGAGPSQQCL